MSDAVHVQAPQSADPPPAPASQFSLLATRRLGPLFATQLLGVFNHNLFKQVFISPSAP